MASRAAAVALLLSAPLLSACERTARPSLTASPDLCREPPFCLRASELLPLLRDAPFIVRAAEPVGHGDAQAQRLLIELPGGKVVRIKWKTAAAGGDGQNRSPRREIAAYELQKRFLDEADYVVPPVTARCMPDEVSRLRLPGDPTPTFAGSRCLLGVVSYWLEGVEKLDGISAARFAQDPLYRRRIALLNILTYLIDHRDTKPDNFAVMMQGDPRAYSVDNGMAFSGWRTPRGIFLREWQDLIVGALPADAVLRLRRVRREELDKLAVVAQFRVLPAGLEAMAPGAPFSDQEGLEEGVRRRGDLVQIGLTRGEINEVAWRLRVLLHRVDSGALGTF